MRQTLGTRLILGCFGLLTALAIAGEPLPGGTPGGPLSPREAMATFKIAQGFRVELAASEPEVIDPVAMAFDERGRLFVAEMHAYPNEGVGTGMITSGIIKILEDRDGDGLYETARIFAEGLRFPTGVMPCRGGLIVTNPPDILFFEEGPDGKARAPRTLYTGFALHNIQQMVNHPQWGLDNWIYCHAGSNGGTISAPDHPEVKPFSLGYRGVRFHLGEPASLEPTSSGGQYALAPDDYQRYFTSTNSQHLRHVVLPDHYLRRNPYLGVAAVTLDIPDHGAVATLFRLSPFESWRVERTRRRKESADAKRFAATELVPGGFTTSGCGVSVYTADLFPPSYKGSTFGCDPANNLVHRDILEPKGATFVARRGEPDHEFLASTDTWFRPVYTTTGPDGALYVLDFYREAIETPLSLPDDIKKSLNLQSRKRGRIWRVLPQGVKTATLKKPRLADATPGQLVALLDDGNPWWRLTAQRLLVERQDKTAVDSLRRLAREAKTGPGRAHALWTLAGLGAISDTVLFAALKDPEEGVREQALRLSEKELSTSPTLRKAVVALAEDSSPRVRFQVAFTLGAAEAPELTQALARLAQRPDNDTWTQTAILSSASRNGAALLASLGRDRDSSTNTGLITRLAAMIGARNDDADLSSALALLGQTEISDPWKVALLTGLGQGLQNGPRPLSRLWQNPPAALQEAVTAARPFFTRAATAATHEKTAMATRLASVRLLASAPLDVAAPALTELLEPRQPADLQLAAIRSLSAHDGARVAGAILAGWGGYSPAMRREAQEALLARPDWVTSLLDAVEAKKVLPNQIESSRVDILRKHPKEEIRRRVGVLFAAQSTAERKKIVEEYRPALSLEADAMLGKAVFQRVCATCHRLENIGTEVGPDLLSALKTKSSEQLLNDILDPSRDVDSRYINYLVTTRGGRTLTGLIAAETASSLTLRRAERAEDTVLRSQIDTVEATPKSLMPEGLEQQLTKKDVANVIAYLRKVVEP